MPTYCGNCFQDTLNEQGVCTVCGFDSNKNREKSPHALPSGSILNGRYIIGKVLGQGGFGITYTAKDHQTGQIVAVKEFFPDSMATRTSQTSVAPFSGERGENFLYGKDSFLQEAQTMAEFIGNSNIVRVYSYFEENGTAYFVMEYVDGVSFQEYIRSSGGRLTLDQALTILFPVMDALSTVHRKGIIHRDVTPDNIYIARDGTVKLLDFGAARYSLGNVSRSLDVILKHGFAPKEQYKRRGRQGPYTDVYSLGATLYYAITGTRPDDAIERSDEDDMPYPSSLGAMITAAQEDVLLKAMAVDPEDRYQTISEFQAAIKDAASDPSPAHFFREPSKTASRTAPDPAPKKEQTAVPPSRPKRRNGWLLALPAVAVLLIAIFLFLPKFQPTAVDPVLSVPAATETVLAETQPKIPETAPPRPVITIPTEPPAPSPADIYADAVGAFEDKDYETAKPLFESLGDYEDCLRYLHLIRVYDAQDKIGAGLYHSCWVQPDGTVLSFGNKSNDRLETCSWTNIISVCVTGHTLALRADGTVTATGTNDKGQCKVSGWKNIIDISAGEEVSAGLRSDGTVVIAGGTKYQDKVAAWTDIVDIACTKNAVFGLRSDGTVVTAGENDGLKDCREWTDIIAISGGHKHLLGLKKDGTVVGTGSNGEGQRRVSGWSDIVAISAGYEHSVGLRADGTVVATGDNLFKQCDVTDWTDVIAVSAGRWHTLALKSDGSLIHKGSNAHGQCYPETEK